MRIRPARPADISVICDLVQRAYGIYIERIGHRPAPMDDDYVEKVRQGHAFVAEDAGVVGLIVMIPKLDHVLVENVAVDPDRHGEGIGRGLLTYAETSARKAGTPALRLYTNAAMSENLVLYPRLGYQEVGRHSDNSFERVFFSKRLDSNGTV